MLLKNVLFIEKSIDDLIIWQHLSGDQWKYSFELYYSSFDVVLASKPQYILNGIL